MKMQPLFPYYYAWGNNQKRKVMWGRRCKIVSRGSMNSICIEFIDGAREIVSRNSVRRIRWT